MRIALFYHSLVSDWNHGNAHFLRGISSELIRRGHELRIYEPKDSWSLRNLVAEHGTAPVELFRRAYPQLQSIFYDLAELDLEQALDGCDLVLVHEWNDHELVRRVGKYRSQHRGCRVLFHDTHHRSVTAPESMAAYELSGFDGVLAFGEVIRDIYLTRGWAQRAWTWHEAADVRIFHPLPARNVDPRNVDTHGSLPNRANLANLDTHHSPQPNHESHLARADAHVDTHDVANVYGGRNAEVADADTHDPQRRHTSASPKVGDVDRVTHSIHNSHTKENMDAPVEPGCPDGPEGGLEGEGESARKGDLVWIGNWGDDERTRELQEFLLNPVHRLRLKARIHGVRYPEPARRALAESGIEYRGWLPNFEAPRVFAAFRATLHVPRRPYVRALPGIPTIRVFEALACGIPLICSPWDDAEGLFTPGMDYLVARTGEEMKRLLTMILSEPQAAREYTKRGRETILRRHTCVHRTDELLHIYDELAADSKKDEALKCKKG